MAIPARLADGMEWAAQITAGAGDLRPGPCGIRGEMRGAAELLIQLLGVT